MHCHIARPPAPPDGQLKGIPEKLSAIIMRLLAKTGAERHQTVSALEEGLIFGVVLIVETQHHIDEFPLGEQDFPERLMIPEKLYGREREVDAFISQSKYYDGPGLYGALTEGNL